MRREPLLLPLGALAGGILLAHFYYFRLIDLALPSAVGAVTLILAYLFPSNSYFRLGIACSCVLLGGIATQVLHRQGQSPKLDAEDGEAVLLSGCVTNPPVFSPQREQFTLNLTPKAAARISVNLKTGASMPLDYGQRVEVAAKIRSPRNF
ncbi:MAG: DUF4131 domain-containing protein, partial [Acidobacteriaceae bacterium]|nr:DUF4131 domain-containing protein [Acidobacteriaceae bacterium]